MTEQTGRPARSNRAGRPAPNPTTRRTVNTNPTETPETAHGLLWRHGLPEDVIDGALLLHAQELAAVQRKAISETDDPVFYDGEAGWLVNLIIPGVDAEPAVVSSPPDTTTRDRVAAALYEHMHPGSYWSDTSMNADWRPAYLEEADAVLAVLPPDGHTTDRADALREDVDAEGDELVCVDECGSCDACGMEPFGTPAEGWREAARFLRRVARDSGDRAGALHGARLIEAELRRLAAEAQQPEPWTADGRLKPHAIPAATTPDVPSMTGGFDDSVEIPEQPAAGVRQQPATETPEALPTVGYTGKGRVWCLSCPRPVNEDVPADVSVLVPNEECAGCGRDVVDVARALGEAAVVSQPGKET